MRMDPATPGLKDSGRMLTSATGRSLIEKLPADRLLTETDAPFTGKK